MFKTIAKLQSVYDEKGVSINNDKDSREFYMKEGTTKELSDAPFDCIIRD